MNQDPELQFSDDEDMERARTFWQEHGRPIVAGVILGITVVGGWNGWEYWQRSEGEKASALYENLIDSKEEDETIASMAEDLMSNYSRSPYTVNAVLYMAKRSVNAEDYPEARRYLEWALEQKPDEALEHVIRLRLAQVLMADNQSEEAIQVLKQADAAAEEGAFAARYQELIGDAEASLGNEAAARQAWETSLDLLDEDSLSAPLVKLKLDNLGKL